MKKFFLILFAALVSIGAMAQCSDSLTAKDYAHAEQFLFYNTYKLVDHSRVDPHWISDDQFWYSDSKADGNDYVLVNVATGKKSVLSRADLPKEEDHDRSNRNEVISPDGTKAAFIKDYNLWVRDISTGKETQLTTDGVQYFGYATDNAGWKHSDAPILRWSPDSKKIATFQQDERKAGFMYLVSTNVGHPKLEKWKYPLPGDSNIIMIQ
ncbi:MAG TPA: DPP IV N-terminal domain-containing protein, partial [Hanamia sp.]|nr:DPP IV N-terminal domain-containing protein [Hanamia sp.]